MTESTKVLLVDDQARNLDALEAILEGCDYELVRAGSADEALLHLLKTDFAAIVCDIKMPGIGGIELAQLIKARKRTQHIPILFLTAHTPEQEEMLQGYNVGAVDYLTKPINPEILRLKLGVFVDLFRKTLALAEANQALADEVAQREQAQDELRAAKDELELRVQQRTAELTSANTALETANSAKDHFLAVLSHELRTPLTPVLAVVQDLLRGESLASNVRESLDMVHRNVELEARLIDDLLDLTRISRGKVELQRSDVDVHQILGHAVRTCDADFRSKQISLALKLDANGTVVHGDRARLLQVFWNLLKNAAKFTPPGKQVEVRTSNPSDGQLQVEVIDTGIGIEPQRLGSIFNAFDQGNTDITRKYGGLGLGLSIGKALVELHGGTITASSEGADCGSCFAVELSTVDAATAAEPADLQPPSNGARAADRTVRLLFVEDHADTSAIMSRLLASMGYNVTTADGVTAALRAFDASSCPFDVVISDIGLPDGSGLDLMRQLRARCPEMVGIAMSGFGMEEDRRRSKEAGFTAHLTKPIDLAKLSEVLDQSVLQPASK